MKTPAKFRPQEFEQKWQKIWEEKGIYQPDLKNAKRPFYNLMMFPYPSAEGLHVGNVYAFTGADIYGRFKRMQGYDVFEPIGLDGFGIHSENYALKVGRHPVDQAKISEKNFYRQLHAIGNGFAWKNHLETYDPDYYRWTQWIFVQMFKHGLAYRKKSPVNFCPSCKTVLSDEQVIDGACERCKTTVERRQMEQWFFKITRYAEKLLQNTYKKDFHWTEKVKIGQRNWIGRSEGIQIEFKIQNAKFKIEVFTTAIDTIFGTTFMVLSPDHPLVQKLPIPESRLTDVKNYLELVKKETKNTDPTREKGKTGVFTGLYAINPFAEKEIPIWIADYVLMDYGTGAIMGVPGHDARDYEFAHNYKLPVIPVIKPSDNIKNKVEAKKDGFWDYADIKTKYADQSILLNSDFLNGMTSHEAKTLLENKIKDTKIGKRVTTYKLRDWCISRQRYWGAPIPMIRCSKCDWVPVPENQLPVLLPLDVADWKPEGTGKGPLAKLLDFVNVACPECGEAARRETDVCDTFLDSSWYFLRYPSVGKIRHSGEEQRDDSRIQRGSWTSQDDNNLPWDPQITQKWLPVTQYTGGAEHTVLHLLYARFVTMALKDFGLLDFDEPFSHFYAHGLIIAEGAKMSKSHGNIIIPDEYIRKYGADTLRTYLMFLGPFDMGGDFRDTGIAGMYRFLGRVWRLASEVILVNPAERDASRIQRGSWTSQDDELTRIMHHAIKEVTEDLENFRYNTAIAHIMEYVNQITDNKEQITREHIEALLLLLAPFAPHMTEELWDKVAQVKQVGNVEKEKKSSSFTTYTTSTTFSTSIHVSPWPSFDPKYLVEDEVTIIVQVNGKLRDTLPVTSDKSKEQNFIEQEVKESERVQKYISGKTIRKVVFVPGKLINFVVS